MKTNQELKELLSHNPSEKYIIALPDGQKSIDFARYFKENQGDLLKLAHELFCSYEVIYDQNRDLHSNLLKAVNL